MLYYAIGPLATVPPALLTPAAGPRGLSWLIDTHDIRVLPTLARAPARASATAPARFLRMGAPLLPSAPGPEKPSSSIVRGGVVGGGALIALPPLPLAEAELMQMRRMLGGRDDVVLTGAAFTEAAMKRLPLESFGTIAFATHGLRAGEVSGLGEPALVLTPSSGERIGLLTASEIGALKLAADWVILSACNSAAGGEQGAPAYSGLASAFALAGARSLLVSHWSVRDDAAAAITVATLEAAKRGATRASALRAATLKVRGDRNIPHHRHPAVWAPFVLLER